MTTSERPAQELPGPLHALLGLLAGESVQFRRAHRLIDCFEWIVKWHAVVAVSRVFSEAELSSRLKILLSAGLCTPSLGTWFRFYREAAASLRQPLLDSYSAAEFAAAVEKHGIVHLRNRYAHGATPDETACRSDCDRYGPVLDELLGSRLLRDVSLVVGDPEGCRRLEGSRSLSSTVPIAAGHAAALFPDNSMLDLWPLATWRECPEGRTPVFFFFNALRSEQVEQLNYERALIIRDRELWGPFHERLPLDRWADVGAAPEEAAFRARIELLTERFHGRRRERENLHQFVADGNGTLLVSGSLGMGKSALVAQVLKELRAGIDAEGDPIGAAAPVVIEYFVRRGTLSEDPTYFLRHVGSRLDRAFELRPRPFGDDLPSAMTALGARLDEIGFGPQKRLVLIVDGLDESPGIARCIPEARPAMAVICTGRKSSVTDAFYLSRDPASRIETSLGPLGPDAIRALLYEVSSKYDDGFTEAYVTAVGERSRGNPLYLALLCGEVLAGRRRVGDVSALPGELERLLADAFDRIIEGGRNEDAFNLLVLLAVSRVPLPPGALAEFLGMNEMRVRATIYACNELLLVEGALAASSRSCQLFHVSVRDWLHKEYPIAVRGVAHRLADACVTWRQLKDPSALRYSLEHTPEHLAELGERDRLFALLTDTEYCARQADVDEQDLCAKSVAIGIGAFAANDGTFPDDDARLCRLSLLAGELAERAGRAVGERLRRAAVAPCANVGQMEALLERLWNLDEGSFFQAAIFLLWREADRQAELPAKGRGPDVARAIVDAVERRIPPGNGVVEWFAICSPELMLHVAERAMVVMPGFDPSPLLHHVDGQIKKKLVQFLMRQFTEEEDRGPPARYSETGPEGQTSLANGPSPERCHADLLLDLALRLLETAKTSQHSLKAIADAAIRAGRIELAIELGEQMEQRDRVLVRRAAALARMRRGNKTVEETVVLLGDWMDEELDVLDETAKIFLADGRRDEALRVLQWLDKCCADQARNGRIPMYWFWKGSAVLLRMAAVAGEQEWACRVLERAVEVIKRRDSRGHEARVSDVCDLATLAGGLLQSGRDGQYAESFEELMLQARRLSLSAWCQTFLPRTFRHAREAGTPWTARLARRLAAEARHALNDHADVNQRVRLRCAWALDLAKAGELELARGFSGDARGDLHLLEVPAARAQAGAHVASALHMVGEPEAAGELEIQAAEAFETLIGSATSEDTLRSLVSARAALVDCAARRGRFGAALSLAAGESDRDERNALLRSVQLSMQTAYAQTESATRKAELAAFAPDLVLTRQHDAFLTWLAAHEAAQGGLPLAREYFLRTVDISANGRNLAPSTCLLAIEAVISSGDHARARALVDALSANYSRAKAYLLLCNDIRTRTGVFDMELLAAARVCVEAVTDPPSRAKLFGMLGAAACAGGAYEAGRGHFESALGLCLSLREDRDRKEALSELLDEASKTKSDIVRDWLVSTASPALLRQERQLDGDTLVALGVTCARLGAVEFGLATTKRVKFHATVGIAMELLAVKPRNVEAHRLLDALVDDYDQEESSSTIFVFALARALGKAGRKEALVALLHRVTRRHDSADDNWTQRRCLLESVVLHHFLGAVDDAQEALARAMALPEHMGADHDDTLFDVLDTLGLVEEAEKEAGRLTDYLGAAAQRRLCRSLLSKGNVAAAVRTALAIRYTSQQAAALYDIAVFLGESASIDAVREIILGGVAPVVRGRTRLVEGWRNGVLRTGGERLGLLRESMAWYPHDLHRAHNGVGAIIRYLAERRQWDSLARIAAGCPSLGLEALFGRVEEARVFETRERWIDSLSDDDDRAQVGLWARRVERGRLSIQEFNELARRLFATERSG